MVKNYISLIMLIAVIFFTAYFTFTITKKQYQEPQKPDTIYIHGSVDSSYIYELQDSLEYLLNMPNDTSYVQEFIYIDTSRIDTIYVKPTAYKEYSYSKPFTIKDSNNVFNFNVFISGTDSLFVDKLQNYLIKKQLSLEVNNFNYNIAYEPEPKKQKWFSLYAGIGNGYYENKIDSYYSGKIGVSFVIKEKHLITINKSFILNGYEVFYMYRLLNF